MREYTQISVNERMKLSVMKQAGQSLRQIAYALGRSPSTVSRELRRNFSAAGQHYWPDTATQLARQRRRRGCKLDRVQELASFVKERLHCEAWSPEQIAGYLKWCQTDLPYVCHETIYKWIYALSQKADKLYTYLTRHKAKRGLRKSHGKAGSRIKNRVSIHERSKKIDKNKTFGHWEADLISCLKNSQFMLVLRERLTMLVRCIRLPNKTAEATSQAIIQLMSDLPASARQSITYDNGGEFAMHSKVNKALDHTRSYFCDPHSPWQKGRVENSIGRLRKDFPRRFNLKKMTQEDFDESIENYNLTPRKGLKWSNPFSIFQKNLTRVALQT
jgi:IS30 family transposase